MKHPDSGQWLAHLYGESAEPERRDLEAHLAVCPDCAAAVGRLRATMADLDAYAVPARHWRRRTWFTAARWALAASLVLSTGFLLGRRTAASQAELDARLAGLRTEFQQTHDAGFRQAAEAALVASRRDQRALFDEFLRQFQTVRAEDRAEWLQALQRVDDRRAADTSELRDGVLALAVKTGTVFAQTEDEVRRLAGRLPDGPSANPSPASTLIKEYP